MFIYDAALFFRDIYILDQQAAIISLDYEQFSFFISRLDFVQCYLTVILRISKVDLFQN